MPTFAVRPFAASALVALGAATGGAQDTARPDGSRAGPCEDREWGGWDDRSRGYACERRTLALSPRARCEWMRGPTAACGCAGPTRCGRRSWSPVVTARARTDADAARLAAQVRLVDDGGTLRAAGPGAARTTWATASGGP
jgi:hypothetical protein